MSLIDMTNPTQKSPDAFRTISEVAEDLNVPQHVLRFWETKFSTIKPMKRGGGRRYYRPEDVAVLKKIHHLLYTEGYTIKGVQKLLKGVSKNAVLAEQKKEQPVKSYGENLPQVKGPEVSQPVAASSSVTLGAAEIQMLKDALADLEDMRAIIRLAQENMKTEAA
jgi:DNA-binding transcriptional MerR regulator